ncbi:MAG: metal ABC transporter ATP-binding protein [Acidimicrobiia bacterium]
MPPNIDPEAVLIEADRVFFAYQRETVLREVSLTLSPGSLLGLVGPSGSGKTTLLKLLAGALEANVGRVRRAAGIRIGYVPQVETVNWYFPVTVDEVILMANGSRRRTPWYTHEERRDVHRLLHELGIGHLEGRHIRELSGGQQQRVFVARAMISDPQVLLLDEPMAGVDVKTRIDIVALLASLSQRGIAVVLTTHDLNGVAAHLPEVACMNQRIIAKGPPTQTLVPDILYETFGAEMDIIEHEGHPIVIDRHDGPLVTLPKQAHGRPA